MTASVHWHEGLFLRPHHLQLMQRQVQEGLAANRALGWPYPYGVVECRLAADSLENMLVQFDRLQAVMPSGLVVDFPENADLPAMHIKEQFEASTAPLQVYLGVPQWYARRPNAIETAGEQDVRAKRLYRVAEVEEADENTGQNLQPVLVRHINARLILEGEDLSDLEVLPLLRVVHAAGEEVGLPRQDRGFVPPCLIIGGSAVLHELIRDLVNQVEASRQELVTQLTRGGFSVETLRGVQFEQMLRLRTLSRFSARLSYLVGCRDVPPLNVYLELRELLAELASLQPDRDLFAAADYDHNDPAPAFMDLSGKIRGLLRGAVAPSFMQVPFAREGDIYVAQLTEEHLTRPNAYFLGIKTGQDPRTVANVVEDRDRFKLMARSMVERRIGGVKLVEERHPPLELPAQVDLHYFRVARDASERMWERIEQEKTVAIRCEGLAPADFTPALYMTIPDGT